MHRRKHLGSLEAKLLDASFLSDTISAGTRNMQQTDRPYSPSGGLGLQCISSLFSPVARLSAVAHYVTAHRYYFHPLMVHLLIALPTVELQAVIEDVSLCVQQWTPL
jgi:hypothetical protein